MIKNLPTSRNVLNRRLESLITRFAGVALSCPTHLPGDERGRGGGEDTSCRPRSGADYGVYPDTRRVTVFARKQKRHVTAERVSGLRHSTFYGRGSRRRRRRRVRSVINGAEDRRWRRRRR